MKVLHYKSNFLNYSETFIKRLIAHHKQFEPVGMCIRKRELTGDFPLHEAPKSGLSGLKNMLCFHLNQKLPFYTHTMTSVKPDIIHAHFGFDGYRMIKPSERSGIPLVVSFYGSDVTRLPSEFDWRRRYRKLAAHAGRFIAVSNLMKKQLIQLGFPEQKISVIRFGLDLSTFSFMANHRPELPVMMAGRMVEKKGFTDALKAIKILSDQGDQIHLDLYGNGPLRSTLEKKAVRWNISQFIHFKNHQPIAEIRRAYHNHSALLVPSVTARDGDQEGIPNTLLEGMASGIPVITTNHSAIPEVITHEKTGFMVPEKSTEDLAKAIKTVTGRRIELTELRENARKKIEQEYELKRMVKKVEAVYLKMIGQTR